MTMDVSDLTDQAGAPAAPPEFLSPAAAPRCDWLNSLLRWMDRLPVPYLLFCLGVGLAAVILFQALLALSTGGPFWPLNLDTILNGYVIAYSLALMQYVRHGSRQALAAFAPALHLEPERFRWLEAELTATPTLPALACALLTMIAALTGNYLLGSGQVALFAQAPGAVILAAIVPSLTFGVVGILMYDLARKLWLIGRIYSYADRLDLFNHRSLYAFSGLTARILAGWLLLSYPNALLSPAAWRSPAWLIVTGLGLLVIIIAFCYTLLHMHAAMEAEKERLQSGVLNRLQGIFTQMHEAVDGQADHDLGRLKQVMDALQVERSVIAGLSTWPWQAGTLAGFTSVILLPLLIWLAQTWIKKLLGF